jgi:hypothetical protein
MSDIDETIVELSGKNLLALIFGSLGVAALGMWMISLDAEFIATFRRFNSPAFIHGFGVSLILFSALSGLYATRKLFSDRRGLVFNDVGVLDCTHGISAGLVPWCEIAGADLVELPMQAVLAVKLKEPTKYLERQAPLKRALFAANHKLCGSPVAFTVGLYKDKPTELLAHFARYHAKYGNA